MRRLHLLHFLRTYLYRWKEQAQPQGEEQEEEHEEEKGQRFQLWRLLRISLRFCIRYRLLFRLCLGVRLGLDLFLLFLFELNWKQEKGRITKWRPVALLVGRKGECTDGSVSKRARQLCYAKGFSIIIR